MTLTRRQLLASGLGAAGGLALASRAAAVEPAGASVGDIEHVVILMQENRSFDHYFGTYRGVRGFNDQGAFAQAWPGHGTLLPFHLDTATTNAKCTNDITHDWGPQHRSWNGGRMDGFVTAHVADDGPARGTATMGYYTRADLPFLYALADAFTICDGYHCSAFSPTNPNRLYSMTATIDPAGKAGGPVVDDASLGLGAIEGIYSWTTMPERLSAQGVSWKVYSQLGVNNNVLSLFSQYRTNPSLVSNGITPTYPGDFDADVAAGLLPQVSWVCAPARFDEHPPYPPDAGESITAHVLSTLVANPALWAKTALFLTYDENGGFFDHVPPPVAPPGTPGEYLTVNPLPQSAQGIAGPIGLGFRVPTLIVSPFSRGGLVCSDTFDHTSLLRFLETRFGVEVPNLSSWRRSVTGDLTSAFNFAAKPDPTVPTLPSPSIADPAVVRECGTTLAPGPNPGPPPYPVPAVQAMPTQEPGLPRRPSGVLATTSTTTPAGTGPLARTGGSSRAAWWGAGLAAAALGAIRLRDGARRTPR